MFARTALMLFCCAALLGPAASSAATASIAAPMFTSASMQREIDAAVAKDRAIYGGRTPVPGVLVGVFDDAGHSFVKGYGFADLPAKRQLTRVDHFRIGSNTKTFVVAVIMQLVDEGKMRLDDPLSAFDIGVKVPNGNNITVRQILDMRSGIFEAYQTPQMNAYDPAKDPTPSTRQIIGWALAQKPYFAPNAGYHYSNTGYLIAGLIIEAVTHDGLAREIETRLLTPYHLTQTSVPHTTAMPNPYAHGYGLDAKKNWEDVSSTLPVQILGAAGDMISTLDDMHRWIVLYTTGKTSSPAMHRALMQCIPIAPVRGALGFGLGLGCSNGWYGYTGGLPGYNTADYYSPEHHLTIVAWVDVQAADPEPGVANAILRDIGKILTPDEVPFNGSMKGL
jgi:D-alanyl-D-alanine carboxypeptidase